jgi:hypothetical protein
MSALHTSATRLVAAALVAAAGLSCAAASTHDVKAPVHTRPGDELRSPVFQGAKVNAGTVSCAHDARGLVLTLSEDFVVPDTPAPHWRLVDARGNAHLLNRLVVKGDKLNRTLAVPSTVPDVAKVQIWCAFAETLLGETALVCSHQAEDAGRFGHTSSVFAGAKANRGTVTHALVGGQSALLLSDDFVVPDTPAPHWQLVDSRGNVYLLNRLKIKGDAYNQTLVIPAFVPDVAKVQIWCAWAETLLGEASFAQAVH